MHSLRIRNFSRASSSASKSLSLAPPVSPPQELRVIFALPKVRALIPEGRRDGPAQIFTDLQGEAVPEGIIASDSGRRPSGFAGIVRLGIPAGP